MATTRPLRSLNPFDFSTYQNGTKYYRESFYGGQQPFFFKTTSGLPALPTANAGDSSSVHTPGGGAAGFWHFYETTAQTLFPTGVAAKGLNISCDLVNNESLELVPGGNSTKSPLAMVAGTDPDFFIRATFEVTDADGSDQFLIGFRKQEAFAVPTSFLTTGDGIYTDFCGIGFATTVANPNPVKVAYDLNNSGSTTIKDPGFTWADGKVHQLEMRVIGRKAYFRINGYRLGASINKDADGGAITAQVTKGAPDAAFTFDSGDTLVPFIFLRHDTNISETLYLRDIEIGHLSAIGEDSNVTRR